MFEIRKATKDDCPQIRQLAEQIFPATYKEIISQEQIDFMMDWMYSISNLNKQMDDGHIYFLAYRETAPVGYVSVEQQNKDLFHLQKIYVLGSEQGTGCGKFLFTEAVKYIKTVHPAPCTMELNVNRENRAIRFYEHMGMHKARQGDFSIGNGYFMNDYIMSMEL
ncbi:MAG: GNAT family N-acetyltransferase [Prevotella sp.]|jgi:ribosomal protein S18 acetylase RimI-like enzyme